MQPLSQSLQRQKPATRFGSAGGGSGLGTITGLADAAFRSFQSNRGAEMLVEDVVGFGLLRTGLDLRRNKMYGDNSWNIPAGAERFFREISSILTDCLLGGMVALGINKLVFDRNHQAFSSQFIQYPSLELFKDVVGSKALTGLSCPEKTQAAFREELARRFLPDDKQSIPAKVTEAINAVWNQKPDRTTINEQTKALVAAVNAKAKDFNLSLRVKTPKGPQNVSFAVNELLDDVGRFSRAMNKAWENKGAQSIPWESIAQNAIKRTIAAKNLTIPIGLAAGMAATFVSPFVLNGITKKLFGIDYFPGETSLRKNQPNQALSNPQTKKGFWEQHFPYITEALHKGNPLPLGLALTPLLAAVGAFDTYNRRFINPINGLRDGTLKKLFDFSKKAPFTSQQQMAAMFALLISSRLLSSRSDNEYKERILDSALGWVAWIIGTPLLKQGVSKLLDGEELLAKDGSVKSREAVEAFSRKALAKNVWVGIGSTVGTIGFLGLGAPWFGIKLTQWNEKRKQQKAALSSKPTQPLPQSTPINPIASKAFPNIAFPGSTAMASQAAPIPPAAFAPSFPSYPSNYAWPQR